MATSRICSIPNCSKPSMINGLCAPHDRRKKLYGDPLKGKAMRGEAARYFRDVVLPYDGDECLTWPFTTSVGGYATVWLDGQQQYVSRILCERQFGPSPTPVHHAAHSCGNGAGHCCTKRHLRWATPAENINDKFGHGTILSGEMCPTSKLTAEKVRHIRSFKGVLTQMEIASYFGVSQTLISQIFLNKIWKGA